MAARRPARAPEPLVRVLRAIERAGALDRPARALDAAAAPLDGAAGDALRGTWMGHALHPLLTDIPIGLWTSANLIDLTGRRHLRPTATAFMALGTAAALPTAASGVAEWGHLPPATRRTTALHAALNLAAVALYAASTAARLARRHRAGVILGLAGTTVATAAGHLGGHLATVRKAGTVAPGMTPPDAPGEDRSTGQV